MYRQDNPELPRALHHWGCYFMSIVYISEHINKKGFQADEIEAIYLSAMDTGIVGKEVYTNGVLTDGCFVNDPISLFSLCGVKMKSITRAEASYAPKLGEYEIRHYRRDPDTPKGYKNKPHDHFVAYIDGKIVDPLGQSNTVRYGFLKSKRIFK